MNTRARCLLQSAFNKPLSHITARVLACHYCFYAPVKANASATDPYPNSCAAVLISCGSMPSIGTHAAAQHMGDRGKTRPSCLAPVPRGSGDRCCRGCTGDQAGAQHVTTVSLPLPAVLAPLHTGPLGICTPPIIATAATSCNRSKDSIP